MSSLAVAKDLEDGTLSALTISGLHIPRNFFIVKRSGRELSPAATALWLLMTNKIAAIKTVKVNFESGPSPGPSPGLQTG